MNEIKRKGRGARRETCCVVQLVKERKVSSILPTVVQPHLVECQESSQSVRGGPGNQDWDERGMQAGGGGNS